jgi:hypothetical protein
MILLQWAPCFLDWSLDAQFVWTNERVTPVLLRMLEQT